MKARLTFLLEKVAEGYRARRLALERPRHLIAQIDFA